MDINNKLKFNDLFDLYGKLLTSKQQEILKLFYGEDCGLSEIAEILGISRQGVYDAISISEKLLTDFEEKLGMLKKRKQIQTMVNDSLKMLSSSPKDETLKTNLNNILLNL